MHEKGIRPVQDLVVFFKKQSKAGRILFGSFFIVLCIVAGTKPQQAPAQGRTGGDAATAADEPDGCLSSTSTNDARTLTGDDFRRGFVMYRVGTGEEFDFSVPPGATVCSDWRAFGAATDWIYVAFTNWAFQVGTNKIDRLRLFSFGKIDPLIRETVGSVATDSWFAPFMATLGIVPAANWDRLAESDRPSQLWHCTTLQNSLVITWQNALLDRDADTPLSFQAEFFPGGRFTYRYDLSRLNVETVSNILAGASFGGNGWTTNALPTNITSMAFYPLSEEDAANQDRDGDGLSLLDELFAFGTDPDLWDTDCDGVSDGDEVAAGTNPRSRDSDGDGLVDGSDPDPAAQTSLADLDGDGIPDAYEDYWFGGTNAFNSATNRDDTGFTLGAKILGGINPTNAVATANVVSTNGLVSWKLFDAFAADWPANATNLVWERTFTIRRTSAWQQFFVSASTTNAVAWSLRGAVLEWETDTGVFGTAAASPAGDSFRIPLSAEDFPYEMTLRIRAAGAVTVCSPAPLHLIAYAPEFRIDGGNEITGDSGMKFSVFTDGSDSQISLVIDHSLRPCNATLGCDEGDMTEFENLSMTNGDFSFAGDANGGTIYAGRPGIYTLPDYSLGVSFSLPLRSPRRSGRRGGGGHTIVVLDPSVSWNCAGHGCGYDGLGYDWYGDSYYEEEYYPLDSKCLRKKWYHDWGGGWIHDGCELCVSSGLGDDGYVTTSVDGDTGKVYVDGVEVWSGSAEHTYDDTGCGGGGGYDDDYLGDECDGCDEDCANGNCDSLEGTTLGSLKFRIPLGAPVKGQVAGFVWFSTDGPITISRSTFRLLEHPDAYITETTQSGTRRVVCHDSRGRDLRIENIKDGARVKIYDTAAQTLEHTWEIVNVNGSASQVRLKKISRLGNVMSDETYTYADGDWTRFDNIAGVGTRLTTYDDFADYGDGVKSETRTTTDAAGNVLSSVTVQKSRIGACDNAVIRETYREESTGLGWKWSQADYWNDPAHSGRHGQPRLVWGNARAWKYMDYDENGHETLFVEQRGSAPILSDSPYVVSNELYNASVLADAFVTVQDFTPLSGDSGHQDDAAKPRCETRYVVTNGVTTLIGRTWTRYTRLNRDGYAAIKAETWRAGAQGVAAGDAGNAYSYKITYADTGEGTPLLMRNAAAETLDENGILTVNAYSLSGGVLSCTARRYGPNAGGASSTATAFPTYDITELNASYGTVLRRTTRLTDGNMVIADEQSIYDDQNRLRSTTYLDGTSLTNAYSCCRLLWKRDREGRKSLRSAQTGTDHLYNAMEDVWLADVSTNGQYRIMQHFYDVLGRETNTVVYAGTTPGEATAAAASEGKAYSTVTTAYPYGGSDYAVGTDVRGATTIRRTDILGDCIETGETVFTNGVEVVKTKRCSYFGGGSSTRREWDGDKWTEERRFEDYATDGSRIEYVVTESHDCGTVTNSVSTYDLLGRLVTIEKPCTASEGASSSATASTTYTYDGASSRILSSAYAAGDVVRTAAYLYNDFGEQIGNILDDVTRRDDTTYETDSSNAVWRVESSSVVGPSTNSLAIVRTQITGLSDSCRRHTITLAGASVPLARTETVATFDPATGIEVERVTSSVAPTVVRQSLHGVRLSEETGGTTDLRSYDALGRIISTSRQIGRDALVASVQTFDYSPVGDLLATHTYTNATDFTTELYAYDMLGNRIATTDELGNTIFKSYAPLGNITAEWGATYPVRYTYNSAGRRTSLSTTRDGVTWDATVWTYDPRTSRSLSKIYADGSTVTYTYTSDNLPLRTTCASGRWKENVYGDRRQIVAVEYSDGETVSLAYDAFLNEIAFSNDVASANLGRDARGNCTNDVTLVGDEMKTSRRTFDAFSRPTGIDGTIYDYTADGLLACISNAIAVVNYAYTPDRLDAGYTLTLSNGVTFTRSLVRDDFRRSLVTDISSIANGAGVGSLAYAYDAIDRPASRNDDTFGYNGRGEVVSATIAGGGALPATAYYGYDEIGNSTNWSANCLNQYTPFTYDLDGNMTQCGDWVYTYDAANRLKSVSSNGVLLVTNFYDAKSRRVKKVTVDTATTFFYDGWNLIEERIAYTNGTSSTIRYFWGKDLSGMLQGAGGVGGLLYITIDGVPFVPCYDANGNIMRYIDGVSNIVATYVYDAFGNAVSSTRPLAASFHFRFSTKYFDTETDMYYYGYRFYRPSLMRWLTRDPIEEQGGCNLYGYCANNGLSRFDKDGRAYFAYRPLDFSITKLTGVLFSGNSKADRINHVIAHEQLIFEDGNSPVNVGYFWRPIGDDNPGQDSFHFQTQYVPIESKGTYNDCVMREAVKNVQPRTYNFWTWDGRATGQYNCQDYADDLRAEYYKLFLDNKIRCKCNLR